MKSYKLFLFVLLLFGSFQTVVAQRLWTLNECIEHALANNITLRKASVNDNLQNIALKEAQAGYLPSVSANINQNVSWRPFQQSSEGYIDTSTNRSTTSKTTESGSYGINANWTIFDGMTTKMNIQKAKIGKLISELSVQEQQNAIVEKIMQAYVQIIYMEEAVKVNMEQLRHDSIILERGEQFYATGSMSRADVARLKAQYLQGVYEVTNAKTQIAMQKLSLKQLLEISAFDDINVAAPIISDDDVLTAIPDKRVVYEIALQNRPEVKSANLTIEQSCIASKSAKAAWWPTITLNAGVNDSHSTGATNAWGVQMKNNLNAQIGVGVNIPILDNRQRKSAIERAQVNELSSKLDLLDIEKNLFQTIEQYWLNATNSQQKYIASKATVESQEASYELLDEQFKVGLKNIADLLQGRDDLLSAKQTLLQDKYTTILNRELLHFYCGEDINI